MLRNAAGVQDAGARVRDAAREGVSGLQAVLEYAPLKPFGIDGITVGTLLAAIVVMLLTLLASALLQRGMRR